jgi:hypothetical protein
MAGALAVCTLFGGCTDEARQDVGDDLRSAVSEAEGDVRSAATEVEGQVRSVVTDVVDFADETARDAVETAARNLASVQGGQAFESAGYPISGNLACTADVAESLTEITVDCSGTTEDGGAAELTGSTSELPGASVTELEGTFTGTVDGEEVFSTDQLGG